MVENISFTLAAYKRGYHIITSEVLAHCSKLPANGIFHLFIKHTSAAICINEDADPSVRVDFESIFNKLVPENMPFLTHTIEGPDDMPTHIKAAMIGSSISIPIVNHKLDLGTWQGIYLCEFRNHANGRSFVASIQS